jgi:hypothetical protein
MKDAGPQLTAFMSSWNLKMNQPWIPEGEDEAKVVMANGEEGKTPLKWFCSVNPDDFLTADHKCTSAAECRKAVEKMQKHFYPKRDTVDLVQGLNAMGIDSLCEHYPSEKPEHRRLNAETGARRDRDMGETLEHRRLNAAPFSVGQLAKLDAARLDAEEKVNPPREAESGASHRRRRLSIAPDLGWLPDLDNPSATSCGAKARAHLKSLPEDAPLEHALFVNATFGSPRA